MSSLWPERVRVSVCDARRGDDARDALELVTVLVAEEKAVRATPDGRVLLDRLADRRAVAGERQEGRGEETVEEQGETDV